MTNRTGRELPSGVVEFTIAREELKDILSEKYNVNVESFSVEEEGISISLGVSEKEEVEEEFEEEGGGEFEKGESDVSNY